jgi:NTE family protein
MKLGLVLSGGGALGAYQVGVVKALAKLNLEPSVVAGASIGALNGAIVAQSTSMDEAARWLEELWLSLNQDIIIQADNAFGILALAAMHTAAEQTNMTDAENHWRSVVISMLQKLFDRQALIPSYLMATKPIESLVRRVVDVNRLLSRQARDFYVSIYEASGQPGNSTLDDLLSDIWRYYIERKESEFKRLKNYSQEQAIQFLLASAALPIAFESVQIGNKHYRDGGMGDRLTSQGNTPMKPLIDTRCTHAIVSILGDGDLWNRYDWNNIAVKEIHPSESLTAGSTKKIDILDFSPGHIRSLIQQGEEDTIQHFHELSKWYKLFDDKQTSEANLKRSLERLEDTSKKAEISVPWKKIADNLGSE